MLKPNNLLIKWFASNVYLCIQTPSSARLQVLWELTEGKLGEAPLPPTGTAASVSVPAETIRDDAEEDEEEDLTEMQSRLQALRS